MTRQRGAVFDCSYCFVFTSQYNNNILTAWRVYAILNCITKYNILIVHVQSSKNPVLLWSVNNCSDHAGPLLLYMILLYKHAMAFIQRRKGRGTLFTSTPRTRITNALATLSTHVIYLYLMYCNGVCVRECVLKMTCYCTCVFKKHIVQCFRATECFEMAFGTVRRNEVILYDYTL